MSWFQREVLLPEYARGCHVITRRMVDAMPEIGQVRMGLFHVFIQHTSASLSINENADPDVPLDLDRALAEIAPDNFPYRHKVEGPDDMPGHVKASLMGSSVSVPICDGRLSLGTWQGIYLLEHRRHGGRRRVVLTVQGETYC